MIIPRIALIGERDLTKVAHRGIEASLAAYRAETGLPLEYDWIGTATISSQSLHAAVGNATAIWCAPGSPYASTAGALLAIQHARIEKISFLGTCGGFQHALMEFARNVLERDAQHEEMSPAAEEPLISKLACSLIGAKAKVYVTSSKEFAAVLGADESIEEFNCNYGINGDLTRIFLGSDLAFVAHDELGQVRAFRLAQHQFFVGTLFQPERKVLTGSLHPVVRAFLNSARMQGPVAGPAGGL